jgi:hypothetical protein
VLIFKKYNMKIICLLGLICFIHASCYCQALIEGKITDTSDNKIILYEPINGYCNRLIDKPEFEIKLDKDHRFKKSLILSSPTVITIQIGLLFGWL